MRTYARRPAPPHQCRRCGAASPPRPRPACRALPLLSEEGRLAAERVLESSQPCPPCASPSPLLRLGTWLEQVWLRLGGAHASIATARANLDLLWQRLDSLPNGEQDLLGPALNAALDNLTALPDPGAGSDCGVQLMTIHKSKGLEFEVVIVPDLQAGSGRGRISCSPGSSADFRRRFSRHRHSGEITEFLVAPLQSKGADRGTAKQWVDRVYRERESQETRRILYVAATRARDELHFFARPACKKEKDGTWTLPSPQPACWPPHGPRLQAEIQQRFERSEGNSCRT